MKEPLKDLLKEHYASQDLSDRQLADLRARLDAGRGRAPLGRRRALGLLGLAVAAVALVAVVVRVAPLAVEDVVAEISYNHNKHMDLEVATSSIEELRAKQPKLDFTLIASERLPAATWELLGARYCSIDGRIASQMRYRNRQNGQLYTLYETSLRSQVKGLDGEHKAFKDGTIVRVWREKDLLLGLAGPE